MHYAVRTGWVTVNVLLVGNDRESLFDLACESAGNCGWREAEGRPGDVGAARGLKRIAEGGANLVAYRRTR